MKRANGVWVCVIGPESLGELTHQRMVRMEACLSLLTALSWPLAVLSGKRARAEPALHTPYGAQAADERDVAAICDSCVDIWLKLNPPTEDNTTKALDPPEPVNPVAAATRCYRRVDSACADCKKTKTGCMYKVEHMVHLGEKEAHKLRSSRFTFCRGHSADKPVDMSLVAWGRVVEWKLAQCVIPLLTPPPPIRPMERTLGHDTDYWYFVSRHAEFARQEKRRADEAEQARRRARDARILELERLRAEAGLTQREAEELGRLITARDSDGSANERRLDEQEADGPPSEGDVAPGPTPPPSEPLFWDPKEEL